jgi:hypothetical protein
MPSSSPVAGSPRRSTTDSVIRSGPLSCLPSRNVPRLDWSTYVAPPWSEVITPWHCLDTSGFTDTSSNAGSRPTRTCTPTENMRC